MCIAFTLSITEYVSQLYGKMRLSSESVGEFMRRDAMLLCYERFNWNSILD